MTIDLNAMTTIQIEWGSKVLADTSDTLMVTRLMAVLLADTKTLLRARTDASLLDPFMEKAAEMPFAESQEAAKGFFERGQIGNQGDQREGGIPADSVTPA